MRRANVCCVSSSFPVPVPAPAKQSKIIIASPPPHGRTPADHKVTVNAVRRNFVSVSDGEREKPKESVFERRVPQYSRFVSQPCRGVVVHGQTPRREGSVSEMTALTKRGPNDRSVSYHSRYILEVVVGGVQKL